MRRWVVVLVEPKEPGNAGGVARVAKNFGAGGIRVVAPRCEVNGVDARRFSSGAAELLRSASVYTSLREAVADRELVIGLTGAGGKHHRLDCTGLVPDRLLRGRENLAAGALVFGREERGLESTELELCDYLWNLPTEAGFPSLNLAQAAGIALAAVAEAQRLLGWTPSGKGSSLSVRAYNPLAGSPDPGDRPATNAERALLLEHAEELLLRTGWEEGTRMRGTIGKLRNVLVRAGATQREVNLLHGVCRQSLLALEGKIPQSGQSRNARGTSSENDV